MTALSAADLRELAELAGAATPGPWEWEAEGFMGCGQVWTSGEGVEGGSIAGPTGDCYPRSGYSPKEDMQFIAACSPEVITALVQQVKDAEDRYETIAATRSLNAWLAANPSKMTDELAAEARAVAAEAQIPVFQKCIDDLNRTVNIEQHRRAELEAKITAKADEWAAEADRYDGQIAEGASTPEWRRNYRNIAQNLRKDVAELRAIVEEAP